jgi:hypothetical protein
VQIVEATSHMRPARGLDQASARIETVEAGVAIGMQHTFEPSQVRPRMLGTPVGAVVVVFRRAILTP